MAWLRGFFGPLESMDKRRWGVSSVKYFLFYLSIQVYLIQSMQGKESILKREARNDKYFFHLHRHAWPDPDPIGSGSELAFVSAYGAQESNPRNRFRQAGNRFLGSLKGLHIRSLFATSSFSETDLSIRKYRGEE
jgi:hypothetical protein